LRTTGTLTFRITFAGNHPKLEAGGAEAVVALDLDQNPDTGSGFYGTEVELGLSSGGLEFVRAKGWGFRGATPPASLRAVFSNSTATFSVKETDLGLDPNAGFNVLAAALSPDTDTAPDHRTFNYQQVPGTQPLDPGPDTRAPRVRAFPTGGLHGKVARLGFWVLDGRGRTAQTIRIYRRNRLLKTIHSPLADSNPYWIHSRDWRVPRNVRGRLRFSVRSVDAAGNQSRVSWAWLNVR
jgi:hypothetical protein